MISDKNKKVLLTLLWAYIAVLGLVYYIKIGISNGDNFSNNLIYYCIYAMIAVGIWKSFAYMTKRKLVFAIVFSFIVSAFLVVGAQIEYLANIQWTFFTLLKTMALSMFFIPIITILISLCNDENRSTEQSLIIEYKGVKWKIFLGIIIAWCGTYLAMFPGIYDYDSINQTLQFLVTKNLNGHHPVMHSFLLSLFLKIGDVLFGSYEIGLGIFTLIQMVLLAYAAMSVSYYLFKNGFRNLFIITMCFYLLFPLHYIMAVWDTKDSLFSFFFLLIGIELLDMIREKSDFWISKWRQLRFVALIVFICMLRNNAFYALAILIPIAFCCFKEKRRRLIVLIILSMGVFSMYQKVLLPSIGVVPGDMREMMSVPCQQLAKVYVESPEVFTEEEKGALLELIPENNIMDYQYRPMIADATKNYLDSNKLKSDLPKYAKLYISIGMKKPQKYIEAFLQNSCGFWYPNKSYPDQRMFHPYTEFNMADPDLFKGDYIYLERKSLFPQYEEILRPIFEECIWKKFPLVSNLFVPGTYFVVLLFGVMNSLYRRNYRQIFILSFWLTYWFTLLISPVALVRYAYPVIMSFPLILAVIVTKQPRRIL